jgi:cytochrome c-type biogenesis protein CcmH/NrfG
MGYDAWQRARRVLGPTSPLSTGCLLEWARVRLQLYRFAEVEAPLLELDEALRRDEHADPGRHANVLLRLGQIRLGIGQYQAAERALLEAERLRPESNRKSAWERETRTTLADLYDAWEKSAPGAHPGQAARWRTLAQEGK